MGVFAAAAAAATATAASASAAAATPTPPAATGGAAEGGVGGDPSSSFPALSPLFTCSEMVTSVCDGLARPLSLRIEQVILSSTTTLPVAFRLCDVIAYYLTTLRGLLSPTSALLAGLLAVHERCISRVEELLALQSRRLREAAPAYPTSLSLTPMVADAVALVEDVLQASASSLLPTGGASSSTTTSGGSGGGGSSGALQQEAVVGGSGSGSAPPPSPPTAAALGTVDVVHVIESLLTPLLECARASAQGLRLLDTATFMCNQVCALQHALAPHAPTARLVQRLAAELSAYEESMVQALSEEVLGECGLLGKLSALRSQPRGARLAELPGLRLGELRGACAALVGELSSTGGGGGGALGAFDRVDNPRLRSRLRRDASRLLLEAFSFLRGAVADPASGYGGAAGAAELPSEDQVSVLLDLS